MPHVRGPHPLPLLLAMALRLTGGETQAMARFLQGLSRYQDAPRNPPMPAGEPVARRGAVRLLNCGGPAGGPAVLLIPSIINGGDILDLLPGQSLVEGLKARGCRVWRIDWGGLDRGEQRLGLSGLVSARLAPLAGHVPQPFTIVGHCLGGTLSAGLATLLPEQVVRRLVLLAAPWRFSGYGEQAGRSARQTWLLLEPLARGLGGLPLVALNPLFWSLDEAGVVRKYQALGDTEPTPDALREFAAVEDWANSGPALSLAAARDIFLSGLVRDRMGKGQWTVRGRPVRIRTLPLPVLDIGGRRDRLVPASARIGAGPGIETVELNTGHVGMIIGRRRHLLWDTLAKAAASG
ncbi:MAG: alpha/beta fold hydrolase [Thermaurantiacus sp.]